MLFIRRSMIIEKPLEEFEKALRSLDDKLGMYKQAPIVKKLLVDLQCCIME